MEPSTVPRAVTGGRFLKWILAAGVVLGAVAALVLVLGRDGSLRLDDLPQGVTAHRIDGDHVFIMRDGSEVMVFLPDARHLPDDTLWWCPSEQVFFEVEHGSMFDRRGRKIGGPAEGGLNQYAVRVDEGKIVIDRDAVIVGGLTPRGEAPEASDADFSRPINSGPGSFCTEPVASPPDAARPGEADVTTGH
jgi:hypothetical protein